MIIHTYTVYALIDPREPTVYRYIGLTRRQLRKRLQDHNSETFKMKGANRNRKERWIYRIKREGFPVQIIALQQITGTEAAAMAEIDWIRRHRATLLNGDHGGRYFEKPTRMCRFCERRFKVEFFTNKRCLECEAERLKDAA